MSIKNIVFDLGNVLIDYDPANYLRSFGCSEETVCTLLQTVFTLDWPRYDRGDYESVLDLQRELVLKYPDYASILRQALQPDWVRIHHLKTETAAYLRELKTQGYSVYLLSNLPPECYAYIQRFPFFHEVDGGVFSFQEHVCKPDERIYRILLERYGLHPQETLFFDDLPRNIAAARQLGIHAIEFTGCAAAKEQAAALLGGV